MSERMTLAEAAAAMEEKDVVIKALADALEAVLMDEAAGNLLRVATIRTIREALGKARRL